MGVQCGSLLGTESSLLVSVLTLRCLIGKSRPAVIKRHNPGDSYPQSISHNPSFFPVIWSITQALLLDWDEKYIKWIPWLEYLEIAMNVIKMLSVIVTEIKADTDPSPLFVFRCRGQHVPSQVTRYHRDVSHQSPLQTVLSSSKWRAEWNWERFLAWTALN